METVSPYSSDVSSTEDSPPPPARRQKRKRQWSLQKTFCDKPAALLFVRETKIWSKSFTNKTFEGNKSYYRCNKVKQGDTQCDAGIYLFFPNTSLEVRLFAADSEHTCDSVESWGLSEEAKLEIGRLLEIKLKPKSIFEQLHAKGFNPKNRSQVNNYIQRLRKSKFGRTTINIGQLESWCEEHSQTPEHIDEAFVFFYRIDDNCDNAQEEIDFQICISTKRLLQHASATGHLHVDATYKLIWEGFPVLIIGTTDSDRHFHPFCITISSDEQKISFKYIFQALKNQLSLSPHSLVSDAAAAIREAFLEVFGQNCSLIMCWAHMRRNVMKKLHLADESNRQELIDDIDLLQISSDEKIFTKAISLFVKKYQDNASDFIDYLNQMWFSSHRNWFEGASINIPSTNNALESFNLVIKREETLRERMPMGQFVNQCLASASRWSTQYSLDKVIVTTPTIELSDWTAAYHWVKATKEVKSKSFPAYTEYYCPSGDLKSVKDEDIKRVKSRVWTSFKLFKERAFKVWIVQIPDAQWTRAQCTCPLFLKQYKCKHVIGLAIRLQYVKPPPAVKQTPIGQKRKRGRPKKATNALRFD